MGRRRQKRLRIALPVTVSGLDTHGNPFTQSATTLDISPCGVRLRGIRCLRARGDPVVVHYKHRNAKYCVAWIGEPGTSDEDVAGLEGLEEAKFLFAEHLPPTSYDTLHPEQDSYLGAAATDATAAAARDHAAVARREEEPRQQDRRQAERRRHPRFNCAGMAHIWENGNEHAVEARVNEISFGGCYVEMMSPLRIGQAIRVELAVNGRTIRVEGIVRTSQPNFGMGLEFIKIAPSEAEKLHRLIAELSGELSPVVQPPAAAPAPYPENIPGKELSEALLRWFGAHDALTRQDFLNLIEQLKHATEEAIHA